MGCFETNSESVQAYDTFMKSPPKKRKKSQLRATDVWFGYFTVLYYIILVSLMICCGVAGKITLDIETMQSMSVNMTTKEMIKYANLMAVLFALITTAVFLLRYFPRTFIYFVLISATVLNAILTSFLWIHSIKVANKKVPDIIVSSIASLWTMGIAFLSYLTLKQLKNTIEIFILASNIISKKPHMFLQSIISFVIIVVILGFFLIGVCSSNLGYLYASVRSLHISSNILIVCTVLLLFWGTVWLIYFIASYQTMVIGGTVASWYLKSCKCPMWNTTKKVLRYHLGSLALGSFLMWMLEILQIAGHYCGCTYFKLSHIITAINGKSFYAGCKAAKVLLEDLPECMLQLKFYCKFILVIVQVSITFSVALVAYGFIFEEHLIMSALAGIIAYFAANCFMNIHAVTIDTLFLCYCIDCDVGDGKTRTRIISMMERIEEDLEELYDNKI